MRPKSYTVGQVVESRAGRDQGRFFLIYKLVDDNFCLIVDGRTHKLNKPKRKRLKHVKPTDQIMTSIADKWFRDAKVFDSEVASSLKDFNQPIQGVCYAQE